MDRLLDILLDLQGPSAYFLIFGVLLACGLGLMLPEDVVLFVAGMSSYYGVTGLWLVIVVCYLGVMIGDSIIFFLGAAHGKKLTKKWPFNKILTEERLALVQQEFHNKGNRIIFAARFMPGLRAPVFFSAGTLHLPIRVFLFYDGLAALLSVPTIVGAVYYFGDHVDRVIRVIKRIEHGIVFLILAVVLVAGLKWYMGHRKRSQAKFTI